MLQFINITGKKETKGFNDEVVIACPTPGDFRITPLVQAKLGLKDGDNALTVIHPEDSSRVFIAKGITGIPVSDENGLVKDGRGRSIFEEGSEFGAILRPAAEGSQLLKLTASAAWQAIGGSADKNKHFSLAEGVEGTIPTGKGNEMHTTTFYELIFKSETNKMARKKKGVEGVEGVEDNSEEIEDDSEYMEEEI